MKNFGSLVLAAILGSVITMAAYHWMGNNENRGVTIEHVNGTQASQVAYRINEKGEAVALDFTGTAEKVTKAVVNIRSTQTGNTSRERESNDPIQQFFFGPNGPQQQGPSVSSGSGVIINADGYIVTNNHVVQDADVVDVTLNDNRSFKAEVIGTDPDTDLALIKINQKDLPFLPFVNSDDAKVGQWVLAVGNPYNLTSTVTAGIISAKGRNINIINSNNPANRNNSQGSTAIESFIQTDAAINPGNSGGALVNLDGGLLGINTAIASPTGSYSGYGFAIPSDIVSKVVEDLIAYGTVQRGWLGISVLSVNAELAKQESLDVTEGAYVGGFAENAKSAAKEAGIEKGDVVVKMDDTPIKSSTALIEYIGRKRPGDKINIVVDRKGKLLTYAVTLKNKEGKLGAVKREEKDAVTALGMELQDVDAKKLKALDQAGGVEVKSLTNGKIKKYTDIREGFIITHVDNAPVKSAKELNELLKKKKPGDQVTFSGIYPDFPREYMYAFRF
ncbi:MAG: Do family serine endopeptidase [Bacteroidetes bacterium]|nr:Do family serine endopeptidase [Bacteroidota bacterium]MBS1539496.1 Do family serine endopeptidase [Bacteroidota bacterium]